MPLRITCQGIAAGSESAPPPEWTRTPSTYKAALPPFFVAAKWCQLPSRYSSIGSPVSKPWPPTR